MPAPLPPSPLGLLQQLPSPRPGQKVIRVSPSKTGRAIYPGQLGIMGGLVWQNHDNPSSWLTYEFVPIQWSPNGLWSNLEVMDRGITWQYYPVPTPAQEKQLDPSAADDEDEADDEPEEVDDDE